jgi:hypothetical protein
MNTNNLKSLRPLIERARLIHFTPCAASVFHHFLFQCCYFGDDKVADGESISSVKLGEQLGFNKDTVWVATCFLVEHRIIIKTTRFTGFGNIYHLNFNINEWVVSINTDGSIGENTVGENTVGENTDGSIGENTDGSIGENTYQHTVLDKPDYTNKDKRIYIAPLLGECHNIKLTTSRRQSTTLVDVNPPNNKVSTINNNTVNNKRIYSHWNSKNIIVHKKLTDKMITKINNALKEFTEDEILKSIDNYAEVLNDNDKYYFRYRWSLEDFMARGVRKFIDTATPLTNFMRDKPNTNPQPKKPLKSSEEIERENNEILGGK